MSSTTPDWFVLFDRYGGVIVLLLLFVFGLVRGWWVLGREYQRSEAELVELKAKLRSAEDTIQRAVHTTWQMVGTVREVVRPPEPPAPLV